MVNFSKRPAIVERKRTRRAGRRTRRKGRKRKERKMIPLKPSAHVHGLRMENVLMATQRMVVFIFKINV